MVLVVLGVIVPLALGGCSAGSRTGEETGPLVSSYRRVIQHQAPEYFEQDDVIPFGDKIRVSGRVAFWFEGDITSATVGEELKQPGPGEPGRAPVMSHLYLSAWQDIGIGFDELLVSYNLRVASGAVAVVEVRVSDAPAGRNGWPADGDEGGKGKPGRVSPWLFIGDWAGPDGCERFWAPSVPVTAKFELEADAGRPGVKGMIDTDYLRTKSASPGQSPPLLRTVQYRVRVISRVVSDETSPVTIDRVTLVAMNTALAESRFTPRPPPSVDIPLGARLDSEVGFAPRQLSVPTRSQKTERPEIAGRICSPTSVSMVVAGYGVEQRVIDMAERAYDARHNIYGNWPRNVQAAFSFGVPGYLTRLVSFREVEDLLALGWPVVISIQTKPGELRGAPYAETDGHLLVITGMDTDGNVLVNDPAVSDPAKARLTYLREDLEKVWLKRTLGTAYVLQRP